LKGAIDLRRLLSGSDAPVDRPFYLLITTATWCEACHRAQPQIRRLAERFRVRGQLELIGIPIDPIETPQELRLHATRFKPEFRMVFEIDPGSRDAVVSRVRAELGVESTPCSLLVDRVGTVLASFPGVPSVSEVGRWVSAPSEHANSH
jgi:thiol-disulfide isomerase/thioredoxin